MQTANATHPANVSSAEPLDGQYVVDQITGSLLAVLINDVAGEVDKMHARTAVRLARFLESAAITGRGQFDQACKDYMSGFPMGNGKTCPIFKARAVAASRKIDAEWLYTAQCFADVRPELAGRGYHDAVVRAKEVCKERGVKKNGQPELSDEQHQAKQSKDLRKQAYADLVDELDETPTPEQVEAKVEALRQEQEEKQQAKAMEKIGKFAAALFEKHGVQYCHALAQELMALINSPDAPM